MCARVLLVSIEANSPNHPQRLAVCERAVVKEAGCIRELEVLPSVLRELKHQGGCIAGGLDDKSRFLVASLQGPR